MRLSSTLLESLNELKHHEMAVDGTDQDKGDINLDLESLLAIGKDDNVIKTLPRVTINKTFFTFHYNLISLMIYNQHTQ